LSGNPDLAAGTIFEHERKSTRRADARDGGGEKEMRQLLAARLIWRRRACGWPVLEVLLFAFVPGLQGDEEECVVGALNLAQQTKADD